MFRWVAEGSSETVLGRDLGVVACQRAGKGGVAMIELPLVVRVEFLAKLVASGARGQESGVAVALGRPKAETRLRSGEGSQRPLPAAKREASERLQAFTHRGIELLQSCSVVWRD